MHTTPKSFKPAISAMFNEFGALGFVSMVVFLVTHPGHGPDAIFKVNRNTILACKHEIIVQFCAFFIFSTSKPYRVARRRGAQSLLRKAARAVGSTAHHLIHDFELLHFALFFVVNIYFIKARPAPATGPPPLDRAVPVRSKLPPGARALSAKDTASPRRTRGRRAGAPRYAEGTGRNGARSPAPSRRVAEGVG